MTINKLLGVANSSFGQTSSIARTMWPSFPRLYARNS